MYSVQMRENMDQNNYEYGNFSFYAVSTKEHFTFPHVTAASKNEHSKTLWSKY